MSFSSSEGGVSLRRLVLMLSLAALMIAVNAQGAETARVVQAEEILKTIEAGLPVDYSNCTIVGDLDISGLKLPIVHVERIWVDEYNRAGEYNRSLIEDSKVIASAINVRNSVIMGSIDFKKATLQKEVDLSGTKILGHADFSDAQFNQSADFSRSQFNQLTDFGGSNFNQFAYFGGSQFNQLTDFGSSQFNQSADFSSSRFNQSAYFGGSRFDQSACFRESRFNQSAYFWGSRFNQSAYFSESRFNQESNFVDAHFQDAIFDYSQFSKDPFFDGSKIIGTLSIYRTKYDRINIRWSSIHDLAYDDTAYYLLTENFKKLGFTDDASECYYSYRCKHGWRLLRQGKIINWFFDSLAWCTYGYGLRPERPLIWSIFFILLGGIYFFTSNGINRSKDGSDKGESRFTTNGRKESESDDSSKKVSIWEAFLLSATYYTSGASAIISSTPMEFTPQGKARYVVVLLRLSGWIFFVLFLSSLTRIV